VKKVQIEARTLGYLATSNIVPAAVKYQNELLTAIKGMRDIGLEESFYEAQLVILKKVSEHINAINTHVKAMIEARKVANKIEHMRERAIAYCSEVKTHFDEIRYHADKLEIMIDDSVWPMPKYRELLFLR
jgi:glutamine synthetase